MPDLHFSVVATPGTQKDIQREVNGWSYPVQRPIVKGEQRPNIFTHQHYVARVQDSIKEQFVTDFGLSQGIPEFKGRLGKKLWLVRKLFDFLIWLSPFRAVNRTKGLQRKHRINTWKYVFTVGELPRKPVAVKTGGKREVL